MQLGTFQGVNNIQGGTLASGNIQTGTLPVINTIGSNLQAGNQLVPAQGQNLGAVMSIDGGQIAPINNQITHV